VKHLAAAIAVAAAAVTASAIAGPAPTAAAWHVPDPPFAASALAIQRLTDAQLAGQRVIYSYPGLTPPRALLRAIRQGEAAGVIFFAGNISSPAQLATVAGELQRADASRRNPVRAPLLLMIDQEGGIVRRLPGPPDLSEKQIGQAADAAVQARLAGAGAAATLLSAGLNVVTGETGAGKTMVVSGLGLLLGVRADAGLVRTGAKAGTFVEIKNSDIGPGAKVPHLSYIGDADVGEGTNLGASTITANYDGQNKHRTTIGKHVRSSVHVSFVAPVRVGDESYTGAGSVIDEDVPPGALGIARARQTNKEGYAERREDERRKAAQG